MNSQRLKELHRREYDSFYESYGIVATGCFSMPWSNELIGHVSDFPVVRSKLPLRCHIWISESEEPGVLLEGIMQYESSEKGFSSSRWEDVFSGKREIEKALENALWIVCESEAPWLRIGLLAEIPRWRSIWYTETVFATLAFAVREFEAMKSYPTSTEGAIRCSESLSKSEIAALTELAWKLSLRPRYGNTVAQGIRSTLSGNPNPVAYFSEPIEETGWASPLLKTKRWELDVTEGLTGKDGTPPIDYWIAYCGTPGDSRSIEEIRQTDRLESERIGDYFWRMKAEFEKIGIKTPAYASIGTYEAIQGVKARLNYRTIELFDRLYRFGWADNSAAEAFCRNVDHFRKLLSIVSEQWPFAEDLWQACRENMAGWCEEVGITPLYSGKHGGSYLVVTPRWACREAVEWALLRMREVGYPNADVIYRSYEDGYCSEGVRVAKCDVATPSKSKVVCLDAVGNRRYGTYMEAISDPSDRIVFDAIGRKIYFRWERLTSKEIPSQNAANDLFEKLLEHVGEEVANRELPASSYSKNRNEMVSKVISPLSKFMKERLDFRLPIKCTGSITEFRMLLEKADLPISLVKKA